MNYYDPELLRAMAASYQGQGSDWLSLGLMFGFLLAVLYKRESVASWPMFRIAAIMFTFAIMIPSLTTALVYAGSSRWMSGNVSYEIQLALSFVNCLGPISIAISFLCLISSMIPQKALRIPATTPEKHPLDP